MSGVSVLFLFSIVLAAAETAFTRMSRIRALSLEEEGRKGAHRLAQMLEHPERTLNVVLLLILVCQMTSASLLGVVLEGAFGSAGLVFGLLLQIVVFFVIGEVAPKTYAIQHSDRAALRLSGFLWAISNFWPLRLLSRGLIGMAEARFAQGQGLWLVPSHGIHTFGMRFPLDIVYLDHSKVVVYAQQDVKPWRLAPVRRNAASVLELPRHTIRDTGTLLGDEIDISTGKLAGKITT